MGSEENCVKVTKSGATHLGIANRSDVLLVAAGDKEGRVGFWNLSRDYADQANIQVQPHTQYISGLKWSGLDGAGAGQELFTCSYDGTCRRLDVSQGVFDTVYATEDHEFSAFDVQAGNKTVYLCSNEGEFLVVDSRQSKPAVKPYSMHSRKINTVHIEPAEGNLFTTSSTGGYVGVWDVRKLPRSVAMYAHNKSCQGAFFAPDGSQRVLTTCYDDYLRVWSLKAKEASVRVSHNCHTGRWVLPFRAIWTPAGDGIVCGHMKRRVSVYSSEDGKRVVDCQSDFLTAIPSRFFVHPTLPLLGAATSSGRIALFNSS